MFNTKKKDFDISEERVIRESFNAAPEADNKENLSADKKAPFKKEADINRYHDPEGLSVSKMNIGLWLIKYKKQLIALPTIILIIISVFSWSYALYGLGYYFLKGMADDRQLANNLSETNLIGHDYFVKNAPKNLAIYETQIFKLDDGKYDFMAVVKNLNKDHAGHFKYSFLAGDYETMEKSEFILPDETKYLLVLGQEIPEGTNMANLKISGVNWTRLSKHDYPDWNNFYEEHMNFVVKNIEFTPAKSTILTEKINLNQLDFTLENKTAYNYHSVDTIILLKLADRIIAVNKYKVNDLMSGEKRAVNITWPGRLGRVDQALVIPELDITRNDIYIDFKGETKNENF